MVDEGTLKMLVEEFSSPRQEFGGKSYITRRREWLDEPMQNIKPLLLKKSLVNLSMKSAKKIYNEMSVGGPKLYPITFAENGIKKIRLALTYLLYDTSKPLEERFFNVVSNPDSEYRLQGVGRAFASTALFLIDPKQHAIWNGAIDGGLKKLGLLPKRKRGENVGETYVQVTGVLKQLQTKCGFEDLSVVDEFVELIFHEKLGVKFLPAVPQPELHEEELETKEHTKYQWMLIKIGILNGYDVWVAQNDKNKEYKGERLGDLCLKEMPQFAVPRVLSIAESIDVIWFKKHAGPIRFFEVEHSTSIYSGLLRLNDVKVDYPINKANIVGPKKRKDPFGVQIHRRTFEDSELTDVCDYLTYEDVEEWFEAQTKIKRFSHTG